MINYQATVKKISERKYQSVITANGGKFTPGGVFATYNEARLDANYLLTKVEQLNGDWDAEAGRKTGLYYYLKNQ